MGTVSLSFGPFLVIHLIQHKLKKNPNDSPFPLKMKKKVANLRPLCGGSKMTILHWNRLRNFPDITAKSSGNVNRKLGLEINLQSTLGPFGEIILRQCD